MRAYQILSPDAAERVRAVTDKLPWYEGQARTKQLTGSVKQNQELKASHHGTARSLLRSLGKRIYAHPSLALDAMPYQIHTPKFNKYSNGGCYHPHTDAPWMGRVRTDLSCTLFLSDPDSYEGGELIVGDSRIKGKPGQAVVYECGKIHEVTPVTSGERVCMVTWIQSRIRDPQKRKLLADFRRLLAKLEPQPEFYVQGSAIYTALLRRWSEM